MTTTPAIRQPCPPGACDCGRDPLLETPGADVRILFLTRSEEKRLVERLENLQSLSDLERLQQRMYEQLGIRVDIAPVSTKYAPCAESVSTLANNRGYAAKPVSRSRPRFVAHWRNARRLPTLLNANDLLRDA